MPHDDFILASLSVMELAIGFVLGIVASVLASLGVICWQRAQLWRAADRVVGTWKAMEPSPDDGRTYRPMKGARESQISHKGSKFSADSNVLLVTGDEEADGRIRSHIGHLILDPTFPSRGVRTLWYVETVADRIEFATQEVTVHDSDTILVAPVGDVGTYGKHVLKRNKAKGPTKGTRFNLGPTKGPANGTRFNLS